MIKGNRILEKSRAKGLKTKDTCNIMKISSTSNPKV
jgi:hypothetical protein